MIEIQHRYTGEVLRTVAGANLSGAYLSGADLCGADLRDADLCGADLRDADLRDADLRDADLRGADLCGADLRGADLCGADLRDADLCGADLCGADLRDADLTGVADALGVAVDLTLPARIVEQITSEPDSHDQSTWHSDCGTRHCIAGFATHLSGALGKYLDKQMGTATAATLLLWRPGCVMPSFASDATDEETLGRLRVMVEQAAAEAGAK